jgi:hypothetical protein
MVCVLAMVFRFIRTVLGWLGRAPRHVTAQPALVAVEPDTPLQHAMPYDEGLLERARTQWQFGDWTSLASLSRDSLQHHPDRAKLALLAAAGHQQSGDISAARSFVQLAQDWGCNSHLVAQILLAGVHNTIGGIAALGGHGPRAVTHFRASIATGMPSADLPLVTQGRVAYQWHAMQLPGTQPALGAESSSVAAVGGAQGVVSTAPMVAQTLIQPALTALEKVREEVQLQRELLDAQSKTQKDDLLRVRKHLERSLQKELLNATKQIEAFLNVQSALSGGDVIPGLHGWPISPDLAAYLIELIRANDYDLVIEFGSGTSTVVMAKALAQMSYRREGKAPVVQMAFEHLDAYHAQTQAQLRAAGLADAATVHLAPLASYQAANGKTYPYYTCQSALQALRSSHDKPNFRALVLVDGPPATTGEHARFPALDLILMTLSSVALDIVLDDYRRPDEKAVVALWEDRLRGLGRDFETEIRQLEREACLLMIRGHPRGDSITVPSTPVLGNPHAA